MSEFERDNRDHSLDDSAYLYHDPIERFWQLPESTRKWLETLTPEKMAAIDGAIKLKNRIEAGGWLMKWISITIISFFVGAAALGESLQKIWAMLTHAVH